MLIARTLGMATILLALGVGLVACGTSGAASAHDAGKPADAAKPGDAHVARDSGTPSDSGAPSDAGTPSDAAVASDALAAGCMSRAVAECETSNQCNPSLVTSYYGTVGQCVERLRTQCEQKALAPGTQVDAAHVAQCASGYRNETCDGYENNDPPDACAATPGSRPNGAACWTAMQCASEFCTIPGGQACGTCTAPAVPGSSCFGIDSCGGGLLCKNAVCYTPVTSVGGACSATQLCGFNLSCVGPSGMATCQNAGAVAGVPCDPSQISAPGCGAGFGCVTSSTSSNFHTCQPLAVAAMGADCAGLACPGLSNCMRQATTASMCVARAAEGEPCNTAVGGPACSPPASCVGNVLDGGVSGKCVLPSATSCL